MDSKGKPEIATQMRLQVDAEIRSDCLQKQVIGPLKGKIAVPANAFAS